MKLSPACTKELTNPGKATLIPAVLFNSCSVETVCILATAFVAISMVSTRGFSASVYRVPHSMTWISCGVTPPVVI